MKTNTAILSSNVRALGYVEALNRLTLLLP